MSYTVSILLNCFLVFMEAVAFIVFSGAFFRQKIRLWKQALSAAALTGLDLSYFSPATKTARATAGSTVQER